MQRADAPLPEAYELTKLFAELVAQERDAATIWPMMLTALHDAVGFDAGYIAASWGLCTEGRGAIVQHDEPFMKRNLDRFLAEISAAELSAYADRARMHDDVWPTMRRKELGVFNEVLDPTGMRHMLVRVSSRQGNVAGFNLERRCGSSPFGSRELTLVDAVAPFLHIVELLTLASQDDQHVERFGAMHSLSRREMEFTTMVCKGLQNSDIGMVFGVSANTVRNTLAHVFTKSGVSNRAELAYQVARSGLGGDAPHASAAGRTPFGEPPQDSFAHRVHTVCGQTRLTTESPPLLKSESGIRYTPPLSPSM